MKKLILFAVVAIAGVSAFAANGGNWPRVYQYAASLTTAVAKNAAKVTYVCDGEKYTAEDICYRVKGRVSLKGVVVCECVSEGSDFDDGYPPVMVASSEDKYTSVDLAEADMVWAANRLGSPLCSKAKVAELGFMLMTGFGEECGRSYVLGHAGFGTAGTVVSGEGLDILSISGSVVGMATAPYCSAMGNNCPRCHGDDECMYAIAFAPCTGIGDYADCECSEGSEYGVAYGTFSVKYNRTLANAIKDIDAEDLFETAEVLVPKVFGKNAINPIEDPDAI